MCWEALMPLKTHTRSKYSVQTCNHVVVNALTSWKFKLDRAMNRPLSFISAVSAVTNGKKVDLRIKTNETLSK